MKKLTALGLLLVIFAPVHSASIEIGGLYQLQADTKVSATPTGTPSLIVGQNSKFKVLSEDDTNKVYAITFTNLYKYEETTTSGSVPNLVLSTIDKNSQVAEGPIYFVKKTDATIGIKVGGVTGKSSSGVTSGPLIVPFKYRLDDKSLTGEVTVSEQQAGGTTGTDNKSEFTFATELLINNWDKVNFGVIYGQDRIEDKTWKH